MFRLKDFKLEVEKKLLFSSSEMKMIDNGHIVICGEIGCGKSSFAKSLIGFKQYSGEMFFNQKRVIHNVQNNEIAYIPQNLEYYFIMANVWDEIVFNKKLEDKEIIYLLEKYQLSHTKKLSPQVLSGGEKVRLVSLLNEINDAKCLILDETVAMNDYHNTKVIAAEIEKIIANGTLVIEISHNINRIRQADQILFIHKQELYQYKSFEEFIKNEDVKKVWGLND